MKTGEALAISSELCELLSGSARVLVLTGAGVSAESGVPTFRGGNTSAVWKGIPFNVISSAEMVAGDLDTVWEWFDYRRNLLREIRPNPAHFEIARWQEWFTELALVTQNIDGLHQKAGSKDVIELHGNIWRARCVSCRMAFEIPESEVRPDSCLGCGDSLRPDVVLFGELLPPNAFEQAAVRAEQSDLCFVVGTSAIVYPAASLPEIAKAAGAFLCEVNPEHTPLSDLCDEVLIGKAGEVLPHLLSMANRKL